MGARTGGQQAAAPNRDRVPAMSLHYKNTYTFLLLSEENK